MNNTEDRVTKSIVIEPGHRCSKSRVSDDHMLEKEYNLLISEYMFNRFKELGIHVALTIDSDVTLAPTNRTNSILLKFGNSSDVIVTSNHVNAGGAEFGYHCKENDWILRINEF